MPTACSTGSPLTFVLSAVLLLLPVVMFALPALTSIYLAVRLRWGRRQLATA
jgi:hypothetical protein